MEAHGGLLPVQELDGMSEAEVKDVVAAAQAAAKAEALAVEEERRRVEAMPDGPEKEAAMRQLAEDEAHAALREG